MSIRGVERAAHELDMIACHVLCGGKSQLITNVLLEGFSKTQVLEA